MREHQQFHGHGQIDWRRFGHGDDSLIPPRGGYNASGMASLIEAIDIKRKMFFEFEGAPYHCIDVEVSKPTARGGQTLVRLKMRNLLTRAVFDKTFKAGEKFSEPDMVQVSATFLYGDSDGFHFMDQESFETLTLRGDTVGDDRLHRHACRSQR